MARDRWRRRTDIEIYRIRRTLAKVKRKLEEALALSRHKNEKENERATSSDSHR